MNKMNRFVALLLAACLCLSCLTGCESKSSKIKDTLSEFEYACQNLDVDAILDCIDPDIADPIRFAVALYSGATGQDYEDFLDSVFDDLVAGVFGIDFDPYDFLSTISFTDIKVKTKKDYATVTCELNFEIAGEQFKRDATIYMIENDENWYVASIDVLSEVEE